MRKTFRSLRNRNYRVWAGGALVSNVGTWMQRIAQDWLVLTELTDHNATAVGIVMALQYGPHILLLPWTGSMADRVDRRRLLIATQAMQAVLALVLGLLTITGHVALWHVYGFAFLLGCTSAFDAPARHTFVVDLVGEADLSNAVALNSTSFNAARMVGPAVAGLLIAAVGTGWAFLLNALSFAAVIGALYALRSSELQASVRAANAGAGFVDGLRYVRGRPDLLALLLMVFLIGTFGLNFSLFISTMSVTTFHGDSAQYGLLMSVMSIGTISGALLAAGQDRPRMDLLLTSAAAFSLGCALAACMPDPAWFAASLVIVGLSAMTFTNASASLAQLASAPHMRGRVTAIRLAILMGGTPIGAPLVGWTADHLGPRWAMGIGAVAGFLAALVGVVYLVRFRRLRIERRAGRWHLQMEDEALSFKQG
ncbi:MAG: MFS transporter [Burkholderiaceae bacterium]